MTSAICQIELTWLVQVIFINVLECKGITIPHFVLLIYFVTDISFCCTTLNNVLLYDIFLDMKLYVQFSSHQWMFRVLLLITIWPFYFWYAVFVTLNQLCRLCVVWWILEFIIILIKISDKFNVDSSFKKMFVITVLRSVYGRTN